MKLINQLKWCLLLWKGYFLDHRRGGFRITTSCSSHDPKIIARICDIISLKSLIEASIGTPTHQAYSCFLRTFLEKPLDKRPFRHLS